MTGIILAFLSTGLGKIVAGIFAAFIAAGAAYLRGRSSGKQSERNRQAAREAKARDVADDIDDAVAGRAPDKNRKRLKGWGRK